MVPSDGPLTRFAVPFIQCVIHEIGWLSNLIQMKSYRLRESCVSTRMNYRDQSCNTEKCNSQFPVCSAWMNRRRIWTICRYWIQSIHALLFRETTCFKICVSCVTACSCSTSSNKRLRLSNIKLLLVHCFQSVWCSQYLGNNLCCRQHVGF